MHVPRFALALLLLGSATPVQAADVFNQVLYRIDVNSDPKDDGEVLLSTTTPGQMLSIVHPLGKGDAMGLANYGLLKARARLDPDFATDQLSTAYTQTSFSDALTISGSNPGDTASVTFRLRVTGSIRQPFYVSEVTGSASALASLNAGSDLESGSDSGQYLAQGPEPIFAPYDETLSITLQFTVGQSISLSAQLEASADAQDLTVSPEVEDFTADFLNQAQLLPILLTGVANPVITTESGQTYIVPGTVGAPEPRASVKGVALSQGWPNPSRAGIEVRLSLAREEHVRARIVDVGGREMKVLENSSLGAGEHTVRWDGRDAALRNAVAGIYFLVVDAGTVRLTRRIVLSR